MIQKINLNPKFYSLFSMQNLLKIGLNITIIFVVIFLLSYFKFLDFSIIKLDLLTANLLEIIVAIAILVAVNSLAGFRWFVIAKKLDIAVELNEVLNITHRSGLFIYFLPAQLAIDAFRIAKFRNRAADSKINNLLHASILDRLLALLSQCFLFVGFGIYLIFGQLWVLGYCGIILIFVSAFYYVLRTQLFLSIFKNKWWMAFFDLGFSTFLTLLIFSGLLNLLVTFVVLLIANGFSFEFSYAIITFSTLASNLATIIPITPNGIGVSELVFDFSTNSVLGQLSVGSAIIYVAFRILMISSYIVAFLYIVCSGFLRGNS